MFSSTKDCTAYSIAQRKAFLIKELDRGIIINVEWSTKKGITKRPVKKWIEKRFTSGDRNIVQANPLAHKPQYVCVADMTKDDFEGWSNINTETLISVKSGGITYKFV